MTPGFRRWIVSVLLSSIAIVPLGMFAQAKDPIYGLWKVNKEKSKNPQPFVRQTMEFDPAGPGMGEVVELDAVGPDGKTTHSTVYFTGNIDGKDYPAAWHNRPAGFDTISWRRIDPYTIERTNKKAGVATGVDTFVVSRDGKTLTETAKDMKGVVNRVVVLDRQ